jgi:hypothetical protein
VLALHQGGDPLAGMVLQQDVPGASPDKLTILCMTPLQFYEHFFSYT